MNKIYILIFLTLSFLFTFAQADSDKEFYEKVRASGVVNDDESILLSSNVYFYPNKKGHGLLSGGGDREKGHIVFTENALSVISWSRRNKAYEVLHSESYSDLASSDVSGNAPMVRLVTETKQSGKYNSFELMDSRNALTPNAHKTKEALGLVEAGIEGLDVKQVATVKDLSSVEVAMQKQRMQDLEERIQRLESGAPLNQSTETECDCKCEQ